MICYGKQCYKTVDKFTVKRLLGGPDRRWKDNTEMYFNKVRRGYTGLS